MVIVHVTFLNGFKLRQSDLWDHVNYGRIIIAANALPKTEPLLPLATDAPFINPAWGSQVLMAACVDSPVLGLAGIQTAHGLLVLFCIGIVGLAVSRKSKSTAFAILAAIAFLSLNLQQFFVVRPQTIGLLFFCSLFVLLNQNQDRKRSGQGLILLSFIVWANLHGSFTMGLFLIGIVGIGRLVDFLWKLRTVTRQMHGKRSTLVVVSRSQLFKQSLNRSGFTRLLILGLCCAAAVLINPYGINVYDEVLRVGGHPNMQNMVEWRPLFLSVKQGRTAAVAFMLIMICMAISRRRLQMQNVLLLLLLGILMLWSSRMINWWAPVASYVIGIHGASAMTRLRRRSKTTSQTNGASRPFVAVNATYILVATLVVLCVSPLGQKTFGRQLAEAELVETRTPLDLAAFITDDSPNTSAARETPSTLLSGLVFCPAEWTGYLMSATRQPNFNTTATPASIFPFRPMASTHVHVIPAGVWNDFLRIHDGQPNSIDILNRYKIDTVIVDSIRQKRLTKRLAASTQFEQIYSRFEGQIWRRRNSSLPQR